MYINLEYNEIVKKTKNIIIKWKENMEKCIENKFREMSEEIKGNLYKIRELNKNEMLWQLRNEYFEKLKKFENLTCRINYHLSCTNLFYLHLPSAVLSSKNKSARRIFEKNKKEWEIEKTALEELIERMLEILK